MKNFEKYEDEVRKFKDGNFCEEFVIPHILKSDSCAYLSCSDCGRRQMLWFVEECEESETDWNQIEVDTPILVRQGKNGEWLERHFAKYENGDVYAWVDGQTSWTGADEIKWKYAKLAEVDWNKIEVDTPILVRDYEDGEWIKRYFAEYKDGKVYAWNGGRTGQTESYMTPWNYAKLSEDEEERKELEVDWSKVNVDTPILVGEGDGEWVKRYFAEYKDGIVYAWCGGSTSWDANNMMMSWKYAKLAESEEQNESKTNNQR